jgi:hypothetical protein
MDFDWPLYVLLVIFPVHLGAGQIFDLKSLKQVRRTKLQNYRKSMKKDLIEMIMYFFSLSQLMGGPKPATLYFLSHSPAFTIMLTR